MKKILLLSFVALEICSGKRSYLKLPESLLIGVSTSSYQVEGAWNVSGKTESVQDHFVHRYADRIIDHSTGDVACDFYHKYKEDIQRVKDMGLNHFRFSLSWPRILPTGKPNLINQAGLRFYHSILDELDRHDIMAIVTLYHYDHPQSFEDEFGGWLSEKMAYAFADYARVVFREFGHRVKIFTTINEPNMMCYAGYKLSLLGPGYKMGDRGMYLCTGNILKGHALAYRIYDEEYRHKYHGQVGIVILVQQSYSDPDSMDIAYEFFSGMMANPIFSRRGDYPRLVKRMVSRRSKRQGLKESRLESLSRKWVEYIRGTSDYFGLNFYSSDMVRKLPDREMLNWEDDSGLNRTYFVENEAAESPLFNPHPKGLGDVLRMIKRKYRNPPIYILENGIPVANGTNDLARIEYMHGYMREMIIAIKRDRCDVKAYTIWSFMDSFEWSNGYTLHFGLYQVDFNDSDRKRTPKKSVEWLKAVMRTRELQHPPHV